MSIKMQGTWCITNKSKNTLHLHKIVISGADTGNGAYNIDMNSLPILVSGQDWKISIKKDLGNSFVDLDERIRFPYKVDNKYQFDLEVPTPDSHNQYACILSCCTPQTTCDFIIYGNVSTYDQPCFFNPYHHFCIVIETRDAFFEALKYDALRLAIKKLYLDRLSKEILISPLERSRKSFVPIIIPVHDESIIPPSLGQILKIGRNSNQKSDETNLNNYSITTQEIFTLIQPNKMKVDLNRQALINLFDQVLPRSITEPLGEIELQFYEYIRTGEELFGTSYSGEGKRKRIGSCISDRYGNYIFHFYKSKNPHLDTSIFKLKFCKNTVFQFMPDILVQIRSKKSNRVIHETIPYWNVPLLKRINICIPKKKFADLDEYVYEEDDMDLSQSDAELILI